MSTRRVIYRNLNKSKQVDPTGKRYVYSYCDVKANGTGKGLLQGHEYGTLYATDCVPVITDRKHAVRSTGNREVFAWIVGTLSAPVTGQEIRITLNPFTDDEYKIKATGAPVDFSAFRAVKFAPDGVFGIIG